MRLCYNQELLRTIEIRDKCQILDDITIPINRETKITYICKCYEKHSKNFRLIYERGAFCKKCSLKLKKEKYKATCIEKYGVENPMHSQEVKEKSKATCIKKYGVEFSLQSQAVREKSKATCLEKYGVENPFQSEEIKEKSKATCIKKYGVEFSLQSQPVREKSKATYLEKYGVENPFQSEEIKEKIKATWFDKYGTEYPMQNAEVAENASKCSYRLKTFIFPCGKTIQVQGYEPYALEELIQNGFTSDDIITSRTEVPEVWYMKNDKKCRYYCDIYIPKEKLIIEVKSIWTYQKDADDLILKEEACKQNGYTFELWIYDGNGKRT